MWVHGGRWCSAGKAGKEAVRNRGYFGFFSKKHLLMRGSEIEGKVFPSTEKKQNTK